MGAGLVSEADGDLDAGVVVVSAQNLAMLIEPSEPGPFPMAEIDVDDRLLGGQDFIQSFKESVAALAGESRYPENGRGGRLFGLRYEIGLVQESCPATP